MARSELLNSEVHEWTAGLQAHLPGPAYKIALAMLREGYLTDEMLRQWGVDRIAADQVLKDLVGQGTHRTVTQRCPQPPTLKCSRMVGNHVGGPPAHPGQSHDGGRLHRDGDRDRTLVRNQPHLLHALRQYEAFDNAPRPRQGIADTRPFAPRPEPITDPDRLTHLGAHRRDRLGGGLHECHHAV
jgi:hypothetical protein